MTVNWRAAVALAVLAVLGWIGWGIAHAGADIAVAPVAAPDQLVDCKIEGKRLDGRAWSLDCDTIRRSPDGAVATIGHVKDGLIHRPGKPDVHMRATGVTVNTVTNDLTISGPVTFIEDDGNGRRRVFRTTGARYSGPTQRLHLDHTVEVTENDATLIVADVAVNFRTGDVMLGRIEATKPGT